MLALWFGLPSFAEVYEGTCGENVRYSLDTETGVLALTGEGIISSSTYTVPLPWDAHKKSIKKIEADEGIEFPQFDWLAGCESIVEPQYNKTTFIYLPRNYRSSSYNYGAPARIKVIAPYAFSKCQKVWNIYINAGCEVIGKNAFSACPDLEDVHLPSTVKEIGENAFYNCKMLRKLNMPEGVESVGANCFRYCNALTGGVYNEDCFFYLSEEVTGDFTIPGSPKKIAPNAFAYGKISTLKIPESVKEIGKMAFYYNTGLQRVEMPSSLEVLGDNAFTGCQALEEAAIPESVHKIGDNMFGGCSVLKKVTLPEMLDSIGQYAFQYCTGLEEIQLPSRLTYIGSSAFLGCSGLKTVNIPESLVRMDIPVFIECGNLTSPLYNSTLFVCLPTSYQGEYTVPDGIKAVAGGAFSSCNQLTAVNLPASVEKLGYAVFEQCTSLERVNLPEGITSILNYTFKNCTRLESVTLPEGLTQIGSNAFEGCTALAHVDIPDMVASIGSSAFQGCTMLSEMALPHNLTTLESNLFRGCTNLKRVTIPAATGSVRNEAFYDCTALAYIDVESGNQAYASCSGMLCDKDLTETVVIPPCLTDLVIPATLAGYWQYNLPDCKYLRSATLYYVGGSRATISKEDDILGAMFAEYGDGLPTETETGSDGKKWTIYKREYKLPETLEKLVFYCDSLSMDQFVYTEVNESKRTKSVYLTGNLDLIDTLLVYVDTITDTKLFNQFTNLKVLEAKRVENLANGSFTGMESLEKLTLPQVKTMEEGCLADLKGLKELTLPFAGAGSASTATNFGTLFNGMADDSKKKVVQFMEDGSSETYYLPAGLEKLTLSEGCETLAFGTFYNCNMLHELTLPSTLYMVGEKALYGCAGLTDIYCKGADPSSAYSNTFEGVRVNSCKLHVPHGAGEMYKRSTGWKDFYYIEEEAPITVAVAKNIENAGVIYGMNEYQLGETAELKAVAHSGYVFSAWTEDGQVVSEEETYSFVVEGSRSLIAVFVPVSGSNSVETEAGSTSVAFTWEAEEGASCYQLNVYRDEAMTQLAGSLWFDAEGNPVKKRSMMLSATIDGLEASTGYYYRMTAYNEADQAISQYTGTFETTDADAISETLQDDVVSVRAQSGGIIVEGAVGKVVTVFTLSGKMAVQKKAENQTEEITLERGFYIVKVGNGSYKTVVK